MLTTKQLTDIKELQRICEAHETIQLKLNWDMLKAREANENYDLLHYENDEFVGFMGIYGFGTKVELCGMVHPRYRRQGIFTKLLDDALKVVSEQKLSNILLNAPSKSLSAKEFLKNVSCSFDFTEYQMKWSETDLSMHEEVKVRNAVTDDLETGIQLDALCFGFSEAEARLYNERIKRDATQGFYMIDHRGKTVGKIRVAHTDGEAWIYGFAVFPEFQGMGIGRKALSNAVLKEQQNGYPIFLEVEAKNAHALGLYESCGFNAFQSQDYYVLSK